MGVFIRINFSFQFENTNSNGPIAFPSHSANRQQHHSKLHPAVAVPSVGGISVWQTNYQETPSIDSGPSAFPWQTWAERLLQTGTEVRDIVPQHNESAQARNQREHRNKCALLHGLLAERFQVTHMSTQPKILSA